MKNIIKILVITSVLALSGCAGDPWKLEFDPCDISEIMATTVVLTADIKYNGSFSVTERGFCWGTSENSTVFYNHVKVGSGTGTYSVKLSSLKPETTYYVRPYAIKDEERFYGKEMVFKTKDGIPTIVTSGVTNITVNSAQCGGNITDNGGAEIIARGICWSTSPNPTISDNHTTVDVNGTGSFTSYMTELTHDVTYYVRAYVINSTGTYYGNPETFKTKDGVPTIITSNITNININSAQCGGTITDDGGAEIIAKGICWSTSSNPTISDNHTVAGSGTGSFTSEMTGLTHDVTYYVRAYVINSTGTYYGNPETFKTKDGVPAIITSNITNININSAQCGGTITDDGGAEIIAKGICWSTSSNPTISDNHTVAGSGTGSCKNECSINGHEYVDLGLPSGLKWAACNVGADSPEEYGDYFAWGETAIKDTCEESNSITSGKTMEVLRNAGIIDTNNTLTPSYDAARVNWGGNWRLPTSEEMHELVNVCTWERTSQNGKKGHKVTGPNGKSIFLPFAGRRINANDQYVGWSGYYWSSNPFEINTISAYGLYFFDEGCRSVDCHHYPYHGYSVRPVSE